MNKYLILFVLLISSTQILKASDNDVDEDSYFSAEQTEVSDITRAPATEKSPPSQIIMANDFEEELQMVEAVEPDNGGEGDGVQTQMSAIKK